MTKIRLLAEIDGFPPCPPLVTAFPLLAIRGSRQAFIFSMSLFCFLTFGLLQARAQGTPPTLSLGLILNSTKYLFGDPFHPTPEPIQAEITLRNTGSQPVITSAGFSEKPFYLFLTFVGPDGKPITAAEGSPGTHEGGPPTVVPVDGALLAVEKVEVLPAGFTKSITIPDLRAFYHLPIAGRYSVKAVVSLRTYPSFFTNNDANYANLDSAIFVGTLETANRFSLIADADGDGYAYPEPYSLISGHNVPDCDDNDDQVNPGMQEIVDGKDNDCNPATVESVSGVVSTAVPIDIMPGTFPNIIKKSSKGTTPVAILSTANLDATTIDPKTVKLAGASVATRSKGVPMFSIVDINLDGRLDLMLHFTTSNLQLTTQDTQAQLIGTKPSVQGLDSVQVIP